MGKLETDLYSINKQAMSNVPPYDLIVLNRRCSEVAREIWNTNSEKPTYWMLLCRERNDYTIFNIKFDYSVLGSELKECLNIRGEVLTIDKQADNNYEIWIRDFDTKENVVYYLFDYNKGVISV